MSDEKDEYEEGPEIAQPPQGGTAITDGLEVDDIDDDVAKPMRELPFGVKGRKSS